jgi:hypothetical protein
MLQILAFASLARPCEPSSKFYLLRRPVAPRLAFFAGAFQSVAWKSHLLIVLMRSRLLIVPFALRLPALT